MEQTLLILQVNPFDSNWVIPYQGGCSQFLPISCNEFYSSICHWEYEFSIFFGKYYCLCIESFCIDFRCVHRFQLLKGQQPVRHPSKFPPRAKRIQGIFQVRFSFQIEGFLTGLSQRYGNTGLLTGLSQRYGNTQPITKRDYWSFTRFSKAFCVWRLQIR